MFAQVKPKVKGVCNAPRTQLRERRNSRSSITRDEYRISGMHRRPRNRFMLSHIYRRCLIRPPKFAEHLGCWIVSAYGYSDDGDDGSLIRIGEF